MAQVNPPSIRLKTLLLERGMSHIDLASKLSVSNVAVSNMLGGNGNFSRLRRKAELFLGEGIWSGEAAFSHNNIVAEHIGIDPILSTLPQLRRRAKQVGLTSLFRLSREELITRIFGQISCMNIAGTPVPPFSKPSSKSKSQSPKL